MGGVLHGIKPVVIAIVVQALWGLAPKAIKKSRRLAALGVAACVAVALGVDALAVLVGTGSLSILAHAAGRPRSGEASRSLLLAPAIATSGVPAAASVGLGVLLLTFLKLGAVVFGSGYASSPSCAPTSSSDCIG